MLVDIHAARPFADLDELLRLLEAHGAKRVRVSLNTLRADLARQLVEHGNRSATVRIRAEPTAAMADVTRYVRLRIAGYVDAHHAGGCLRVWHDRIQVDALPEAPKCDGASPRIESHSGRTVFDLCTDDIDAAIEAWTSAACGDELVAWASGAPVDGIDALIQAAGDAPFDVESVVPVGVAAAVARALPEHPIAWTAGDLVVALPDRSALVWRVAPVSPGDEASIHAMFERARR